MGYFHWGHGCKSGEGGESIRRLQGGEGRQAVRSTHVGPKDGEENDDRIYIKRKMGRIGIKSEFMLEVKMHNTIHQYCVTLCK